MLRITLAFLVGAAVGAASTYFCLKNKFEEDIEAEAEELRVYYNDKYRNHVEKEEEDKEDDVVRESFERLSEEEYPEDDLTEEERKAEIANEIINSRPKLIKADEFDSNPAFDKQTLYYYTDDGLLLTEEDEIVENYVYLLGDTLTKYGFVDNDEKVIHVRNGNVSTDFEVIKVFGTSNI